MARTLAQFHTLVSNTINRGTTFDSVIPDYVRMAIRVLEREQSFEYMLREEVSFTITDGTRTYGASDFVSTGGIIKKINYWRIVDDNSDYHYIEQIDAMESVQVEEDRPSAFWTRVTPVATDVETIQLVTMEEPDEDYTTEISWYEYTVWATGYATIFPWLVNNAEDVLLAQTMLEMKERLRLDEKQLAGWQLIRSEGLSGLVTAETEKQNAGAVRMGYGWG